MVKVRTRKLWLRVRWRNIPVDVSEEKIIRTLRRSIERKDYLLPQGWHVVIQWKNKESADWRSGNWKSEMEASAESSDGFDSAVLRYLEQQKDKL